MKRIAILGAAMGLGASLMRTLAGAGDIVTVDRERPVSQKRRRVAKSSARFSNHKPHYGKKEQERAKRCYMSNGILCQMSKRQHAALAAFEGKTA